MLNAHKIRITLPLAEIILFYLYKEIIKKIAEKIKD
jgi:hypothetical protein